VLFGLSSVWTARRMTRPLGALLRASMRLGRGDVDTPLVDTGRKDEFGRLATAFEQMRISISRQQHEIRQLAYFDRLTGLPNRLKFRDEVKAAVDLGQPLAVLLLDLDRFKHVNDVLGYATGDRLLQGVAGRLQDVLRPGDIVARMGEDEFALLLPLADATLAQTVAARIAQAFEEPMALDDQRVDLSASQGIACWPAHAADVDALLSRAEVAMYAAKRRTAGAQLYEATMDSGGAQTLCLLSELRHAVDNGELLLYVQPKVALNTGQLCGAEALIRWQHPERGLLMPMEFIPFAEQTGYVRQLTLWVFEEAARQWPKLAALGVKRFRSTCRHAT
jgi:diguanylate cyclase (GGDEF)-like protein